MDPLRPSNMTPHQRISLTSAALVAFMCACASENPYGDAPPVKGSVQTQYEMKYIELVAGSGAEVAPDKCIYAHYTGWLTDGTKFDSSRDTASNGQPRTPLGFHQGKKAVITGWDQGFAGMKVGGQRRLIVPYQLAYGENGRPPIIPPKATLIFDVELMDVRDGPPAPAPDSPPGTPPARCPAWS